ncbi:MAG: cation-transporting P-type ATPase, partial [Lapillicoccus sp.]
MSAGPSVEPTIGRQDPTTTVLSRLSSSAAGLTSVEAAHRLETYGPNAVRNHHPMVWQLLARQLRSAVLILLAVTAAVSFFLGDSTEAVIIGVILLASVGLGFTNEYRAERAASGLHDLLRHTALVLRDGVLTRVDVTDVVPGDVVHLSAGALVPADLRLLTASDLECDEAVLTGESEPAEKSVSGDDTVLVEHDAPPDTNGMAAMTAFMGTVVRGGVGTGVVVSTGGLTEFGRIALGLGEREPETEFQRGLRSFSLLLLQVAIVLTGLILVTNLLLHRPIIESLLFSLAIAVGITPQLLPAVVSTSLAVGARELARRKVLVKRLICIEDLGDMDILVTDKTGTLTDGAITFTGALDAKGVDAQGVSEMGLLAAELDPDSEVGGDAPDASGGSAANALDAALASAVVASKRPRAPQHRLGYLPFDHERRMASALVQGPDGTLRLVSKGAPESVLARCQALPVEAQRTLDRLFADGSRVVAVASRDLPPGTTLDRSLEHDLSLAGFLVFLDRPKADAGQALARLAGLGVAVKIATGDNA